jgi:hypothetical protein
MLWLYLTTMHWLLIVNRILYLSNSHSRHHRLSVSSVIVMSSLRNGKPPVFSEVDSILLWGPFEVSSSIKCGKSSVPTGIVPQARGASNIHLDSLIILLHLIYRFGPFRYKRFQLRCLRLLDYLRKKDSRKLRVDADFLLILSLILLLWIAGAFRRYFRVLY